MVHAGHEERQRHLPKYKYLAPSLVIPWAGLHWWAHLKTRFLPPSLVSPVIELVFKEIANIARL
ncbi:unnamed protein product [Clonostachys chloroleuca]|uniref:Uncharacterized protein n=1 Tax=Clonostachys chloroleuca TaxID=1926264 RepID=A0AA35LX94_9HYPO|nr:unnamed protein product [Clonostachys chloroleuca]